MKRDTVPYRGIQKQEKTPRHNFFLAAAVPGDPEAETQLRDSRSDSIRYDSPLVIDLLAVALANTKGN